MRCQAYVQATGNVYRDVYVLGDVHGNLEGLQKILQHAGLMDPAGDWYGRRARLIQCGDMIDRGEESEGCLDLLLRLRRQAARAGGAVDLLVGNHELTLARGDGSISDVSDPKALGEKLAKLIAQGCLQAARSYRQYLMTHAGLSAQLVRGLIAEVRRTTSQRVTVAALARHLNQQLKAAFLSNDFSHPMFHVGTSRGGRHEQGGIFWADFDHEHAAGRQRQNIWQVFGHTPPRNGTPLRVAPDQKCINVDVGICSRYGGYRAYVKLLPDRVVGIHCGDSESQEEVLVSMQEPALV